MKTIVCVAVLLLPFITNAQQPGTLDKSFGDTGIALDKRVKGHINVIALQSDSKIISGGSGGFNDIQPVRLTRYDTDGSIDESFGTKGFTGANELSEVFGIAVGKDDAIIALGRTVGIKLAKYNKNGGLDSFFGASGTVFTKVGNYDEPVDIAIQLDGKIVVGGYIRNAENEPRQAFVIRYLPDGKLDESFNKGGVIVFEPISDPRGLATLDAIALQKDGKIIVAVGANKPYVYRFDTDGSLDRSFGDNGEAYFQYAAAKIYGFGAKKLVIQEDGKIVGGGSCFTSSGQHASIAVARLTTDGSIDSEFGQNGLQYVLFDKDESAGYAVLLQPDGKIIVSGWTYEYYYDYGHFALARFNEDGSFDASFGDNGQTITVTEGRLAVSKSALLQKDGKIVLGGDTFIGGNFNGFDFNLLTRYNGYDPNKQPLALRIKRWMKHHGISWQVNPKIRYYAIQKSSDGIIYKEIAKVNGSSNNYEDAAVSAGDYYRLTAVAKDGSRTYSNTILIDEAQQTTIFPNPVRGSLQLQHLPISGNTNVSIVDLQGNVRSSATTSGGNYSVSTDKLTPGNYLLKLQHNGAVTTQPFVKE